MSSQSPTARDVLANDHVAVMKKARTQNIERQEVDFNVLEYSCVDGAVLARLGNHSKESYWKIQAGKDTKPIEIRVHVDKTVLTEHKARVECDGERIFPDKGEDRCKKMREDTIWKKPFRGVSRGINVKHFFEVRAGGSWHPATLTCQREDGRYEAMVTLPDLERPGEFRDLFMPGFVMEGIREVDSKQPLQAPQKTLQLLVPKKDPMHATLSVEDGFGGQDLMTHYFARPTPVLGSPAAKTQATFKVNKARSKMVGDMGHVAFQEFLKNEVYFVSKNEHSSKKMEWKIAIGMDAVHTLILEKKWNSKIATLSVDGTKLVESNAEDLDCHPDQWECKFHFKGERVVNFEVHETNVDGDAQDTTSVVQHKIRYSRECAIKIVHDHDVRTARLSIDGVPFGNLKLKPSSYHEDMLTLTPQVFSMSYPIFVPFKVNEFAPGAMEAYLIKARDISLAAKDILVAGAEGLKELASPKHSSPTHSSSPKHANAGEASPGAPGSWLPRLLGCCSAFDSKKEARESIDLAKDRELAASKN